MQLLYLVIESLVCFTQKKPPRSPDLRSGNERLFLLQSGMPTIELRTIAKTKSPTDLILNISDKTYDYMMNSDAPNVRVSSYLDRDWPRVEPMYEEVYLNEECTSEFKVKGLSPGSKTRWTITLPDAMKEGEQITIQVSRVRKI